MARGRVKASALYLVIVIALAMAVICSALIAAAYYYRAAYEKTERYADLQANLNSAVNMLVAGRDTSYDEKTISLFGGEQDSVSMQRMSWGLYDVGVARAFIHRDTLCRVFSLGHLVDSAAWCALYLADNGRPLGLSGKTAIRGDAFIPPAGVTQAYVDNQGYTGDKDLVKGKKHDSNKELPGLDPGCLRRLKALLIETPSAKSAHLDGYSLTRSFTQPTLVLYFKHEPVSITSRLSGNIILYSDTTITIDSLAHLQHVVVIARSIIVNHGD